LKKAKTVEYVPVNYPPLREDVPEGTLLLKWGLLAS
jgi:hypothetical protein